MAINEVELQEIRALLHSEEVRKLILDKMPSVNEVRTTTGKVAKLFGIPEQRLRDWDRENLLKPERDPENPLSSQRQYSIPTLRKLVILIAFDKALKNSGRDVTELAPYIEELFQEAELLLEQAAHADHEVTAGKDVRPINRRIIDAREELSWRYYASHALRLSLCLIRENVPNTPLGLVLPLRQNTSSLRIKSIEELPLLGPALVGWLSKTQSSHTLLTEMPSFEYVKDFDLLPLTVMENEVPSGEPGDTYLILDRQDRRTVKLSLSESVITVINRLLVPLLEQKQLLYEYFTVGMRDELEPATDLSTREKDSILSGLAEMIVRLGGSTVQRERRWRFCSILVPEQSLLPLQQRSLVICAQSKDAPKVYKIGSTVLTSTEHGMSLSIHAFRSGNIQYRNVYASKEPVVAYSDVEIQENVCSAIAVPIGGEDGLPLGVFYVGSTEVGPFSPEDQRVLRFMGRMIEELLRTFQARIRPAQALSDIIEEPAVVDRAFRRVFSETNFFQDVEKLLKEVQYAEEENEDTSSVVSFIALDMDQQGKVATKYGDIAANNLNLAIAERIAGLVKDTLFKRPTNCTLYHIHSDVFYIMLRQIALKEAREKTILLKENVNRSYKVDIVHPANTQPSLPDSAVDIVDVTMRFGVTSYSFATLRGMLQQYPSDTALTDVSSVIDGALRKALVDGRHQGGNKVFAWDEEQQQMILWPPQTDQIG